MKYCDRVLKHPIFEKFMQEIRQLEADRVYCRHELEHGVDVARLAWIYYMEDKLDDDSQNVGVLYWKRPSYGEWVEEKEEVKDLIYTCALLHDIGRVTQYRTGIHHSISGVEPAMQILQDIEAPESWVKEIMDVVSEHSHGSISDKKKNLEYYITKADHDCRLCFACQASDSCKWSEEEKNHTIED